ncbi:MULTISPECIES: hypothetical protein [Pseudomonas]|uniref:Uncharacterized protein n=1 Tax=Pseudomonas syringae pv. coryli TaxID=317659 RepID=A0A0P9PG46_9PSED|nr:MULTISPECIES: hypothetical protein [Pseudomonas]EKG35027.1 hypothetical protein Pav013_4278 [Pseudomonas syringae pv. avellanae str. ISPaVe013]KPX12237.1 Uncharacterized protein ALO75_00725 [Pseudomonas syringae pv. coryli]PIO92231.1 hypothetical protein CBI55_19480 [Pseudomonas syringae]POP74648.1 hypothetical protein CXB38_26895 [Pseudomonas syringae]POP77315.1 hypothetical protein CXB37_09775 [Pseudomonas syringae pv. syringae]
MTQDKTMNITDNLDYIAACELAECPPSLGAFAAPATSGLLKAGDVTDAQSGNEGAVVAGSVLAFPNGMSAQSKQDVMNSFLFATLVANKAFSSETQGDQWYDKFNEVLSKVGWLSTHWNYARYRATQQRFTMDEVGLEILGSAIAAAALPGPASVLMLKVAADAVAALQARKEPLRLFESQTKAHRGGSFRIASCIESEDSIVSLAMAAVSFQADSDVTNVLFWEWQDTSVQTWKGEDNLLLNTALYARHRELIEQRLGDNVSNAIAEYEI